MRMASTSSLGKGRAVSQNPMLSGLSEPQKRTVGEADRTVYPDIDEWAAALKGEEELQKFCQAERPGMLAADAKGLTEALTTLLPEVDKRAMLEDENTGNDMVRTMQEALRVSCDGWVDDDFAFIRPWGFDLGEIKVPVFLYQGSEDKMVPLAHGKWLASHLPEDKVKARLLDGEGHISILSGYMDEMLDNLLAVVRE